MQKTQGTRVRSLGQGDALEEETATHPRVLAWRIQGWRSLVGYSPWGCKESDTTDRRSTQTRPRFLRPFPHAGPSRTWSRVRCALCGPVSRPGWWLHRWTDLSHLKSVHLIMHEACLNKAVKQLEFLHSDWFWCCTRDAGGGHKLLSLELGEESRSRWSMLTPSCMMVSAVTAALIQAESSPASLVWDHAQLASRLTKASEFTPLSPGSPNISRCASPSKTAVFKRNFRNTGSAKLSGNFSTIIINIGWTSIR